MTTRPALSELGLSTGKKARLHRILYKHGLGNGTAIFLPYDQGLEHGPRDFFANPAAGDPRYIVKLAVEGGFNGIAIQIGLAEKFYWDYAGEVPLILKLNGKTDIPPDAEALSPLHAEVEEAVRLGADAVGYTLYVGTPAQDRRLRAVPPASAATRERFGMPLIVWAYPRGSAIEAKGGKDSFYAVDYAARTASELGADVVKVNFPHPDKRDGVKTAVRRRVHRARRRSTPSCARPTARWCWSPAARRPATRRMHREGADVDGGRRDRPDLRAQRLAARARRVAAVRGDSCATCWPSTRLDAPSGVVGLRRAPRNPGHPSEIGLCRVRRRLPCRRPYGRVAQDVAAGYREAP